eukprot:Gb_09440 [translate_table: standard]
MREQWRSLVIDREIWQVKRKARMVSGSRPAKVAVVGLQHHGKSSFVNSVFRVIYKENEKFVLRAETGPPFARQTTVKYKAYDVLESPDGLQGSHVLFTLIDSPAVSVVRMGDRRMLVPAAVAKSGARDHVASSILMNGLLEEEGNEPDCVVLCVNSMETATDDVDFMLENMAILLRSAGIPLVVVMTHKDEALSRGMPVGSLLESVSTKTSSNAVFCLSNYEDTPWPKDDKHVYNSFEMDCTVIQVLKQLMEFCRHRRQQCISATKIRHEIDRIL